MSKRDEHFELVGYIMGVLSIVFSVLLQPTFGLGFGITGLVMVAKMNSDMARKSRKLSIIGIVLSVALIVALFILIRYTGNLTNPLA